MIAFAYVAIPDYVVALGFVLWTMLLILLVMQANRAVVEGLLAVLTIIVVILISTAHMA